MASAHDMSYHDRRLSRRLEDAEFRAEFEREKRAVEAIDAIVNDLDHLRDERGLSKAQLARDIGKNEASIRRLLTAPVNPELRTVVEMADALGAEVRIVARSRGRRRRRTLRTAD
jgi:ribosome-binding protein aMBF1 (putative translation factor)